jgi:hypothetical protein
MYGLPGSPPETTTSCVDEMTMVDFLYSLSHNQMLNADVLNLVNSLRQAVVAEVRFIRVAWL